MQKNTLKLVQIGLEQATYLNERRVLKMSTYAVSDIHGDKKRFLKLLEKINFNEKDTMYILGDVIDRGSEPIKLLQFILSQKNMVLLMGNHEKMMIDGIKNRSDSAFMDWLYNGGGSTLDEYSKLDDAEKERIMIELEKLSFFEILNVNGQDFILCHAGIVVTSGDIMKDLEKQVQNQRILWNRRDLLENHNNSKYIIIHGHTATCGRTWSGDGNIDFYDGERKINIDCGCGRNHQLGCLCLENFHEYYV